MKREFICENCKEMNYVRDEEGAEEKKIKEYEENFKRNRDEIDLDEMASICDDCYEELMNWYGNLSEEERKSLAL